MDRYLLLDIISLQVYKLQFSSQIKQTEHQEPHPPSARFVLGTPGVHREKHNNQAVRG